MARSKVFSMILFSFLFLFGAVNLAFAVSFSEPQNLDDWTENIYSGSFSTQVSGTVMQMSVVGSDANQAFGDRRKDFADSIGGWATFNVSSFEGNNVNMGISQILGYTSKGTGILAEIGLDTFGGDKRIRYRVREYDFSASTFIKTWAVGFLGDFSGAWEIGENVTIAFGRLGTQIYFYSPSKALYTIIQPFDFAGVQNGAPLIIWGWADKSNGNSMTATISNVLSIYP
jgi:hypothetical protein